MIMDSRMNPAITIKKTVQWFIYRGTTSSSEGEASIKISCQCVMNWPLVWMLIALVAILYLVYRPRYDEGYLTATRRRGPSSTPCDGSNGPCPGWGSYVIGWSAPTDDGGSPITGYQVQVMDMTDQPPTQVVSTTVTGTTYTLTPLNWYEAYQINVSAINAIGTGPASTLNIPAVPPQTQVPGAPTSLTADLWPPNSSNNPSSVPVYNITWSCPLDNGYSTVTNYMGYINGTQIFELNSNSSGSGGSWSWPMSGNSSSDIPPWSWNTSYTIEVYAINSVGTGTTPATYVLATGPPLNTIPGAPGVPSVSYQYAPNTIGPGQC